MQFTPSQLRDTVGLSIETFRHWKRVLPPFVDRKGQSPCFTVGDLLAAAILHRLTDKYGIRVGHLTDISRKIAGLCNTTPWAGLENKLLIIDLLEGECRIEKDQTVVRAADVVIFCPLTPIMSELQDALLRSHPPSNQDNLFFPPTEVTSDIQVRRRGE